MKPILILFATREGHTRLVADYIASVLLARKLPVRVICAREAPGDLCVSDYSAALLAASVHVGKHEPELVEVVMRHRTELERLPTAFISVSLTEAVVEDPQQSDERRLAAQHKVEETVELFCRQTGWRPERIKPLAGALLYTQYGMLTRLVMKTIARSSGSPTDTSRDHVLTDWEALARFAEEFADELVAPAADAGS